MIAVVLLLLGIGVSPRVEVCERDVELLETNTVRDEDGTVRFVQVIAWDSTRDDENRHVAIDRGYKIVNDGYPCVHECGSSHRVIWWCGAEKVYVLNSKAHLITETDEDREAQFRQYGGRFRPCW